MLNLGAKKVKEYILYNHVISKIDLATFVPANTGSDVHKNRLSHGLVLNCGAVKAMSFDGKKTQIVGENDIIYLPKGVNYQVFSNDGGNTYCINYQCLDSLSFNPFIFRPSNTNALLNAFQNAEKAWRRMTDGREYLVMSYLYKILYELKRQFTLPYLPESKQELIKPAVDYIHKHYTEEIISANVLCELCSISYDYLRKLFEKFYGCSPVKYINGLKLKRAKELLSSGLYSVSETAFLSGFSDLSHFSRFFKDNVGVLPSEYVKE
jgi:AraC-like DNA-binding protein